MEPVTPRPTIRVVLVDDDPLVLAGLRMILGGAPDLAIVGEAADGQGGIELVEAEKPDVALMDIRMPRMDGLQATRALRGSATRVIVLTTFDTDEMVLTALQNGASGFLLKDTPPVELIDAVRRVAAGDPMLSPSVTSQLIAALTKPQDDDRRRARAPR